MNLKNFKLRIRLLLRCYICDKPILFWRHEQYDYLGLKYRVCDACEKRADES